MHTFDELVALVARLHRDNHSALDRQQALIGLRHYLSDDALTALTREEIPEGHPPLDGAPHTDGAQPPASPISALDGLPESLSSLQRAHWLAQRASRVGFDWPDIGGVRDKIAEEMTELDEALISGDSAAIVHEYGDLLLSVVNLARFVRCDPDTALDRATVRFATRFRGVEAEIHRHGYTMKQASPAQLDAAWERVKQQLNDRDS